MSSDFRTHSCATNFTDKTVATVASPALVPSGMAGGNQVIGHDQGQSLPGSPGSTPMPQGDDLVTLPRPELDPQQARRPEAHPYRILFGPDGA